MFYFQMIITFPVCFTLTFKYAEVQNVHSDGSLALHTRNLNYGKVGKINDIIRSSSDT